MDIFNPYKNDNIKKIKFDKNNFTEDEIAERFLLPIDYKGLTDEHYIKWLNDEVRDPW
jgi:hypothetical protein